MTMRLAEARELINQALTPVDKEWYTLDVVFNRDIQTVRINKKDIDNIIQDVTVGHPRCTLYAQSVRRLMDEEEMLADKYPSLDREKYYELKWEMLDLYIPPDRSLFERFRSLGPNPTMNIDYDNKTRFHLNNLLRKQWMSKRDSDARKSREEIVSDMYQSLRDDPKKAFTTNRYLPSIIEYYCQ